MTAFGKRAATALAHRGPDATGVWADARHGLVLAHRRLAVIALGPGGAQPMLAGEGRWAIAYNGEIYNYRDVATALRAEGAPILGDPASDTAVLLSALVHWGIAGTLPRLEGMFAFAFWDRERQRLWLARDRFGQKPLYISRDGRGLRFASELRGIADDRVEVSEEAVRHLVTHGYVPAPLSVRRGVEKLQPGSWLGFSTDSGDIERRTWFRPDELLPETEQTGSEAELLDALDARLTAAVDRCMVADVPVGAFLSGGVDSTAIVLAMTRHHQDVRTFTVGMPAEGYDESRWAEEVAAHLGTRHRTLHVSPEDALAAIPELPRIWDEPFADSSQLPTYLVSRLAREDVTVVLSGDGGDELFGGYQRHISAAGLSGWLDRAPLWARRLAAHGILAGGRHAGSALARLGKPGVMAERLQKLARIMDAPDLPAVYRRLTMMSNDPPIDRLPAMPEMAGPGHLSPAQWMMLRDASGYLPDDILVKLDRAAMAAGLEGRVPMLDAELVRFAWSLPLDRRISGGAGKVLLRKWLRQHLPAALVDRPKMGFALPLGEWLRGPLRGWAEDLLAKPRLDALPCVDPHETRRLWQEHLSGRRNHHQQLWPVLMLSAWWETGR